MNEKHREVEVWLGKVYGEEKIPAYEINQRTIDILYDLMKKNEEQDKWTASIVDDLQQKADEYAAEANRLGNILNQLGIPPSSLSQSGTVSLRTLTNIALLLDVKDTSNSSLLLALSEWTSNRLRVREARRTEQRRCAALVSETKAAMLQYSALTKALEGLDEQSRFQGPELTKKAEQAGFLQTKAREYKAHIAKLQQELTASGAEPSIYHATLLKKEQELQELRDQLKPMKSKLDSYHDLPPDMALARVKVEEAKRELAQLEDELARQINIMHM